MNSLLSKLVVGYLIHSVYVYIYKINTRCTRVGEIDEYCRSSFYNS